MHYTIYRGWFGENPPLHPIHYANLKNDRNINPKGEVFLITSSSSMSKENFDIQSKMCEALGVKMLNLSDDEVFKEFFNEGDDEPSIRNIEDLKTQMKLYIEVKEYAKAFDFIKLFVLTKPRSIGIDSDSRIVSSLHEISEIVKEHALEYNYVSSYRDDDEKREVEELLQRIREGKEPIILSPGQRSLKYFMNIGTEKAVFNRDMYWGSLLDMSNSQDSEACGGTYNGVETIACTKDIGIILGRATDGVGEDNKINHQDKFYSGTLDDREQKDFDSTLNSKRKEYRMGYRVNMTYYTKDMLQRYKQDKDYVESLLKTCTTSQNSEPTNLIPTASSSIEGGSRQSYNTDKAYESNKPHEKVKWHDGSELFEKW